jgi:hypothetical protein
VTSTVNAVGLKGSGAGTTAAASLSQPESASAAHNIIELRITVIRKAGGVPTGG